MARKGNHQRNGLHYRASDDRNTTGDSVREELEMQNGSAAETDQTNADNACQSKCQSHGGKQNKTKLKNKQKSSRTKEKSDEKIPNLPRTSDRSSTSQNFPRSNVSSHCPEEKGNAETFCNIFDGPPIENNHGTSLAAASRNLQCLLSFVIQAATDMFEGQKPWFREIISVIRKGYTYAHAKLWHAYQIMLTWTSYFGKLVLLLSMVWLECSIRGLDSLIRLGTTSFLTTVWCSILSITAMIGFLKMLIITVIAGSLAIFFGIGLAILIVAALALGILWLYGSFWTTGLVSLLSGAAFLLGRDRIALLITTIYSIYCARSYVGWLGLFLGLNLSFISSDILIHLLKSNINDHKPNNASEQARQPQSRAGFFFAEGSHSSQGGGSSQSASDTQADCGPGSPSTSGTEAELNSEDEVARLLKCTDHYSALGLTRYESVDVSQLKREYRKKAMLVHPDKNMGNERAAEAFKKLQNAYEILLDSLKRKTYDEDLRREELLNYLTRFQNSPQKKSIFRAGFSHSEAEYEGPYVEARRIACKKCNDFHVWICTNRSKSQARWCQDCKELHQAKDGDGWVEQAHEPLLFGLLQKVVPPRAYVCAKSKVYEVTEWFSCQGMNCAANTHKPSFHVNTNLTKLTGSKGTSSSSATRDEATMTEEEFFDWLQNLMQSGMFETNNSAPSESPSPGAGAGSWSNKGSSSKKKRRGKKQW